jgi:hypothetical protein
MKCECSSHHAERAATKDVLRLQTIALNALTATSRDSQGATIDDATILAIYG